jgi:hypothetical protein
MVWGASAAIWGVFALCLTVDPEGWLSLAFLPAIAILAMVFGVMAGLGTALLTIGLAIAAAGLTGGSFFEGWAGAPGSVFIFFSLAAGVTYGSLRMRSRPLWLALVSIPVFPLALAVLTGMSVSMVLGAVVAAEGRNPVSPYGQPVAVMEMRVDRPACESLPLLKEVPWSRSNDAGWAYKEIMACLQSGAIDQQKVEAAVKTAIERDWHLGTLMFVLSRDYDAVRPILGGLIAGKLGLSPEVGAAAVEAAPVTSNIRKIVEDYVQTLARKKALKHDTSDEHR